MKRVKIRCWLLFVVVYCCGFNNFIYSQDVSGLLKNVRAKLDKVSDYVGEGVMKTDVIFIKAPLMQVKILYKKPNKFKLKRGDGISLLPKGGITLNMSSLLGNDNYTSLPAGEAMIENTKVKVVKLLPSNDAGDVVLTVLYIDPVHYLILKATSTTKDNGTYETRMTYGKYAFLGLPDKVIFEFNAKDFKLPKGLTMEFDTGEKPASAVKGKAQKGSIEILYSSYQINKGISDSEFK
ncbi:MAG: hypothetical protein NVS3B19_13920 [Ginsengibacter sp.]